MVYKGLLVSFNFEADEFDLLLQEGKEPLPKDILTMEELA